ncbi:MAG: nucleotide exchange factor GrpE [Chloroflexi bacterium]|nr:nucleotide exchange factor GrpE [Chloroflexota bacterium]
MSDRFDFDDEFYPVPASAMDADPTATMRELLYRVSRLEQVLEEEKMQALASTKEFLLEFLSLSDDIAAIVDRWGVTTKATEAAIIRNVVALGRKLRRVLEHHQVTSFSVVGKPLDPETSDVVGSEARENLPPGVVIREQQVGYTWPYGLLRRAQVIVNSATGAADTSAEVRTQIRGEGSEGGSSEEGAAQEP